MASDHSWISRHESRYLTDEYKNDVDDFIKFACENLCGRNDGLIRCPCGNCKNKHYKVPIPVKLDLFRYGMLQWYTRWTAHGEKMPEENIETITRNVGDRDDDIISVIFIQKFVDPDPTFSCRIQIQIWANPYLFYPFDTPNDMYYDADHMLRDFGEANRHCENMEDEPNSAAKEFH